MDKLYGSREIQNGKRKEAWRIAVVCALLEFVLLGFCSSSREVYLVAITDALEIKRSLFSINNSIRYLSSAIVSVYFHSILQYLGVRKTFCTGSLLLTLSMLLFAFSKTIWGFYIGGALLGMSLVLTTTPLVSSIIQHWFQENTGKVLGFVLAANGIGGAVATQVVTPIIYSGRFGYQTAYKLIAVLVFVMCVIGSLSLKEHPQEKIRSSGQKKLARRTSEQWDGIDYTTVRKKPFYYGAVICVFVTGMILAGVNGNYAAHMKDIGLDETFISQVISLKLVVLAAFKVLTGVCYDKYGLKITMLLCDISAVIMTVLFATATNTPTGKVIAFLCCIITAIALPLETVMVPLVVGDLFGKKEFDKFLGILLAANSVGYAIGEPLLNVCYDWLGTYIPLVLAYGVVMALITIFFQMVIRRAEEEKKLFITT